MATASSILYENPNRKPLGELYFAIKDNGVSTKVPALSKHWLQNRTYTHYRPLPVSDRWTEERSAELDEWLATTESFRRQLQWLLSMEHFRFWSYMVHDPGCIAAVVSFLQEATPFTQPIAQLTSDFRIASLYQVVLDLELKIIFRLATDSESPTSWIATDQHADLVYSNFLLTIPTVFDLLMTYGRSNAALLTELLDRIFAIAPRLQDDLKEALTFMKKSFASVQEKLDANTSTAADLDDLAAFTLDCTTTVALLLEVGGAIAVQAAGEVHLDQSLTGFYDMTIPGLYKQICEVNRASPVLALLNRARMEVLSAFRSIVNSYLEKILNEPSQNVLYSEFVLSMLQEALSDPVFVVDYKRLYPVVNDLELVQQASPDIDTMKIDYLVNAYNTPDEHFLTTNTYPPPAKTKPLKSAFEEEGAAAWPIDTPAAPTATNDDIQNVLDVLPHLQPSFVAKLLQRYDNPESAIAAVLEGNLPPDMDESTTATTAEVAPAKPSSSSKPNKPSTSKLASFGFGDDDSVIVKRNKGFPGAPKTLSTLLDDKSHVRQLKSRYQEYGLIAENDYDDEYDDSYDALAESEAKSVSNPNRFAGGNLAARSVIANELLDDDAYADEESSSDDEPEPGTATSSYHDKSKNFCENPEVARERRAQNWNNKMGARAPRRPAADVVGKPKGQGQETATVHSRQKKEANKSTKANHSRRSGAAWKRNTGMIPS